MKTTHKIGARVGVSLAAGLLLALIMPSVMNAVWPYFQDSQYRPYPLAVLLANTVNLAPVIFCHFHYLPASLTFGKSQNCYVALWYLNGPYYALVIFLAWSVLYMILNRRSRRNVQQ